MPVRNRGRELSRARGLYRGHHRRLGVLDFTQQYMTVSSVVAGVLLLLGMLGVILVLLPKRTNGRRPTG